jgi:hypothetical protein
VKQIALRVALLFLWFLCVLFIGTALAQDSYTISFSSTATEEAVLSILYTDACATALASNQTLPGGCVESPPGQCLCTPSNAQKRNFLAVHYLKDGFEADRRAIYVSRGALYRERYPTMSKADRDICDTAAGFTPLLP